MVSMYSGLRGSVYIAPSPGRIKGRESGAATQGAAKSFFFHFSSLSFRWAPDFSPGPKPLPFNGWLALSKSAAQNKNKSEVNIMGNDIYLECKDCGKEFVFEAGEQEFYKQKGYADPVRCPECRKLRKQKRDTFNDTSRFNNR